MEPVDHLILNGLVVTEDADQTVIADGAVAVRGNTIAAVGPLAELDGGLAATARQVIDAGGGIVMPGLVNIHTHGGDTLFRGLIDDLPLEPWLERLWRVEREILRPPTVATGALLAYTEMIHGGTTTALDMFWFPEASAEAARRLGFRLVTGPTFFDDSGIDGLAPAERLPRAREFIERYRTEPLITPAVLAHGTYTVSPDLLRQAWELARDNELLFATHASETETEVATVRERYGASPIRHLDRLGLLGPGTVLAHCVHLDDEEIALLAERRAVVAHCPLSNLKLGSGVARLADMRRAGVRVALGTDGPVSGNDLDMWLALRLAAVLHKGMRRDPSLLPAREIVRMATRGAAETLGLGATIGSLEPGKRADLILIDLDRPHLTPLYDVYSHLVYAIGRADVRTVLIDGRVVLRDRRLTSGTEDEAIAAVRSIAARVRRLV